MVMEQHRILIIDDDISICELLKDVAESCGYLAEFTTSGAEFKIIFNRFKPDVLILDLHLGDTDGIELLRYLSFLNTSCKVILISGYEERVLSIANKLGALHGLEMLTALQKPISISIVKDILEDIQKGNKNFDAEDIQQAISNHELILYFQPKIAVKNNQIIGVETLLRWLRQNKALIMPDKFIPYVEQNNLINAVTLEVINVAMNAIPILQKHIPELIISINLSGKDLNDLEFPDKIADLIRKNKIPPEKICFEVTETAIMGQMKVAMEILTRLRLKGFLLSVDDFGTGYYSLIELRKMPINELKIDKSFVVDILKNKDDQVITKALIDLGHNLGLDVTAEGVESKEVFERMSDYNCDKVQGFYFSEALPLDQMENWIIGYCNRKTGAL